MFARTIVLLGSRGAGKSSVSVALARELGVPAIDLDREIQAVSGKEISRIFREDGEARFRDLEERALRDALARGTPCVVSPGGGVVLRDKNRALLRESGAFAVYLAARPETLAGRIEADGASGKTRPPLVPGGPLVEARALLAAREAHYRELASLVLSTDDLSVEAVTERILEAVRTAPGRGEGPSR